MTLEIYKTLYTVFLVATIILFVLSIVFFFVFDIWKILSIKTGWAIRKSVRQLNEINAKEDNHQRKKYKGRSMQLNKELAADKMKDILSEEGQKTAKIDESFVTMPLEGKSTIVLKKVEDVIEKETGILIHAHTDEKRLFRITQRDVVVFGSDVIFLGENNENV